MAFGFFSPDSNVYVCRYLDLCTPLITIYRVMSEYAFTRVMLTELQQGLADGCGRSKSHRSLHTTVVFVYHDISLDKPGIREGGFMQAGQGQNGPRCTFYRPHRCSVS